MLIHGRFCTCEFVLRDYRTFLDHAKHDYPFDCSHTPHTSRPTQLNSTLDIKTKTGSSNSLCAIVTKNVCHDDSRARTSSNGCNCRRNAICCRLPTDWARDGGRHVDHWAGGWKCRRNVTQTQTYLQKILLLRLGAARCSLRTSIHGE